MCVTKMRTNEVQGIIGYGCFSHSKRNDIRSEVNDNKPHQHTLFQETAMILDFGSGKSGHGQTFTWQW